MTMGQVMRGGVAAVVNKPGEARTARITRHPCAERCCPAPIQIGDRLWLCPETGDAIVLHPKLRHRTDAAYRQAAINEARARWGRQQVKRTKLTLGFEDLLGLFSVECNTFADIGKLNEPPLSRQAISQLYGRYFARIFGGRTGNGRRKVCTLKHYAVADHDRSALTPEAGLVVSELEKRG